MRENIIVVPEEEFWYNGRKVISMTCEKNAQDKFKDRERLRKIAKANRKAIYCENNDTAYQSITDAANALGLSESAISKCINGKQKSTKGYVFKKVKE